VQVGTAEPLTLWTTLLTRHLVRSLPWRDAVLSSAADSVEDDTLEARAERWLAAKRAELPRLAHHWEALDAAAKSQVAECVPMPASRSSARREGGGCRSETQWGGARVQTSS